MKNLPLRKMEIFTMLDAIFGVCEDQQSVRWRHHCSRSGKCIGTKLHSDLDWCNFVLCRYHPKSHNIFWKLRLAFKKLDWILSTCKVFRVRLNLESDHKKTRKPWNTMAFPKVLVCRTWDINFVWSAFLRTFSGCLISSWSVCPTWRTLWEHNGKVISDFYGAQKAQGREKMASAWWKWPVEILLPDELFCYRWAE